MLEGRMELELRISKVDLADLLRCYVERRLRFALGRFGDRVGRISVRIAGNGSEGQCRISTEIRPVGRVAVQETDSDVVAAIDRATGRIGHLVARELERARDTRVGRESVRLAA
jgi:ribosome-associated translation inhibitor RaiA